MAFAFENEIKKYMIETLQKDKKNLENHERVINKTIDFLEDKKQVISDIMKFYFEK